jgi:hypothetical protein
VNTMVALALIATTTSSMAGPFFATQDEETAKSYLESKYRWAIKTGNDEEARKIDVSEEAFKKLEATSIEAMTLWERPKLDSNTVTLRQGPYETTLVTVEGELTDYRLSKDDQDLHLVLRESGKPDGLTIIGEIPDPSLMLKENPWRAFVIPARASFYEIFKPRSSWKTSGKKIRITGVPFFDLAHGQRGVAKNGVEIHPILKIEVLDTTTARQNQEAGQPRVLPCYSTSGTPFPK